MVSFEHYRRQEEAAWRIHQRMRDAMIASGAKEVAPDMFEVSGDYAELERRIAEAMRDIHSKKGVHGGQEE